MISYHFISKLLNEYHINQLTTILGCPLNGVKYPRKWRSSKLRGQTKVMKLPLSTPYLQPETLTLTMRRMRITVQKVVEQLKLTHRDYCHRVLTLDDTHSMLRGMSVLVEKPNAVHRDLAARNCLIFDEVTKVLSGREDPYTGVGVTEAGEAVKEHKLRAESLALMGNPEIQFCTMQSLSTYWPVNPPKLVEYMPDKRLTFLKAR